MQIPQIVTFAVTTCLALSQQVGATFPSEPIVVTGVNLTETTKIGSVAECQAIQFTVADSDVECGARGVISERGILPVNMWPGQPIHSTPSDCAVYCQNKVGGFYRSFGLYPTAKNMTAGFTCECYESGVGVLKLAPALNFNATVEVKSGVFYDTSCFELEC